MVACHLVTGPVFMNVTYSAKGILLCPSVKPFLKNQQYVSFTMTKSPISKLRASWAIGPCLEWFYESVAFLQSYNACVLDGLVWLPHLKEELLHFMNRVPEKAGKTKGSAGCAATADSLIGFGGKIAKFPIDWQLLLSSPHALDSVRGTFWCFSENCGWVL